MRSFMLLALCISHILASPINDAPLSGYERARRFPAVSAGSVLARGIDEPMTRDLDIVPRISHPEVGTKDLAIRGPTEIGPVLDKRYFALIALALSPVLPSAVGLAIGLYGLARNIYSIYKDCQPGQPTVDCFFSSLDLVFTAVLAGYKAYSGTSPRSLDALSSSSRSVYGIRDHADSNVQYISHVPLLEDGSSLAKASMAWSTSASGLRKRAEWAHHATVLQNGTETHHVMYRIASPEDLGFENDGSYHHFRVQPANAAATTTTTTTTTGEAVDKREEANSDGLVSDYMYRDNNEEVWDIFHDEVPPNYVGSEVANWMETNNAEASCAVPMHSYGSPGGSSTDYGDHGVVTYGWNNQPYNSNGQAGGWVDNCGGPGN